MTNIEKNQKITYDESVVKCCLQKFAKNKELLPIIDKWVINLSKIVHRGSLIINHFLLYYLENNLDSLIPNLNDQNFFYQAFTIGLNGSTYCPTMNKGLKDFYTKHEHLYPKLERINGDKQAIKYLFNQYMVNFSTYLFTTFMKRQKVFVFEFGKYKELNKEQSYAILCKINNWKCNVDIIFDDETLNFIDCQRIILNIKDEKLDEKHLKNNLNRVLSYQYIMLFHFEMWESKVFNIAPIYSFERKFITIDIKVLYFMMKEAKIFKGKEKEFTKDKFFEVLDIKKLSKKKLGNIIQTDGISLCVHFHTLKKPKKEPKNEIIVHEENERVIGIDPGRTNLIYAVEEKDGKFIPNKLTKKQYYNDSHFTRNNKKIQKWNKEIEELTTEMAKYSSKTSKVSKYEQFLLFLIDNLNTLQDLYLQPKFARAKMDNYIHKNKTIDKFLNKFIIKGEKDPIIAYGAAKFNPTGKGEVAGPTTFLAKKCAKKFKIKFIDEFRTTKCCYDCESELKPMKRGMYDNRGLKCCDSSKCSKFRLKSRDQNSGKNIIRCYKAYPERPSYLCRNVTHCHMKR